MLHLMVTSVDSPAIEHMVSVYLVVRASRADLHACSWHFYDKNGTKRVGKKEGKDDE